MNRILGFAVAAVATIALTQSCAQAAHAGQSFTGPPGQSYARPHPDDRRPCVSTAEFNSLVSLLLHHPDQHETRAELEARWEVVGLGIPLASLGAGFGPGIAYRRCDVSMRRAWYGITYRDGHVSILVWGTTPIYGTTPYLRA